MKSLKVSCRKTLVHIIHMFIYIFISISELQLSDEDGDEDSHSRYDKDDPAKSTEAASHDPDGTMEEPKKDKGTEAAGHDPDGTMEEPKKDKGTEAAGHDPDGTMEEPKKDKGTEAAGHDPDGTIEEPKKDKGSGDPDKKTEPQSPTLRIVRGKRFKDGESIFQIHLAFVTSQDQTNQALKKLEKNSNISDGENFAGASLLHLLQEIHVQDIMVIVTRWHSRIALGRTRFKIISQTALELLQEAGLVKLTSTESQQVLKKQEEYLEHMKQRPEAPRPRANLQEQIKIIHGEKVEDRKSFFQAHLAVISSRDQVDQVFKQLKKDEDVANATYNIQAYRIYNKHRCSMVQDCDDDGEYLAGASLLHLLQVLDVQNVMVVVSRWHGGIWLGRDRFKHINHGALKLLQSEGLVKNLIPGQEQEVLEKYFDFAKKNIMDYYTEIPKSSCPKIIHGACMEDRKSTFQAHLAVVTSQDQVEQVLAEIKKNWLVAKATYNMSAYRIFDEENETYMEDFDDDGERGGGESLLHQLQQAGAKNVVAVVTRWHGDILLGSNRFQHINKCASNLLELPACVN